MKRENSNSDSIVSFILKDLLATRRVLSYLFTPWDIPNLIIADVLFSHGFTLKPGESLYTINDDILREVRIYDILLTRLVEPGIIISSGSVFGFNLLNITFRPDTPTTVRILASGAILLGSLYRFTTEFITKRLQEKPYEVSNNHTNRDTVGNDNGNDHPRHTELDQDIKTWSRSKRLLNMNPPFRNFLRIMDPGSDKKKRYLYENEFILTGECVVDFLPYSLGFSMRNLPNNFLESDNTVRVTISKEGEEKTYTFFLLPTGALVNERKEYISNRGVLYPFLKSLTDTIIPRTFNDTKITNEVKHWFSFLLWEETIVEYIKQEMYARV